ncbi:MAG: PAS domain S-box protein [Candidatus Hydrogenedentes bacterium]|nr:PAS domain S-box protein [Candidatus Hydrogenedentota bacterium]
MTERRDSGSQSQSIPDAGLAPPAGGPGAVRDQDDYVRILAEAFEKFTQTTQTMEESYRRLASRVQALDRELADKNRELAFTSDYLSGLLESMSDGVIAIDTEGIVTTFNRAASDVLGYTREEAVGRRFRDVFGREFAVPPGRQAMELRAQDGRRIPVSERDSPMADRANKRIGAVKVFQDLSELEALRERIRQQDRLAAIGEMAATVAHEIRNPLGGIRGFAALLARDIPEDDPRRRLVDKIQVGSKDLERVVNELLEYTRPMELRLRSCSCADLIEAALGYVDLGGRPIRISNAVDPGLHFMVDPDKMRQVFLNILLNATQSIEGEGSVTIHSGQDDACLRLSVSDTGSGMGPAQMEQVFSPFYTTKEKGTGLGLAVAAKIVEGHGGRIEADSEQGKGSTFHVLLPQPD